MSLVIWIGGIIFFSFFAAPSIFKVLDRELAGDVVGDIFPKYWFLGYVCSIVSLGTLIFLWRKATTGATVRIILLSIMMAISFYSGLVVGPKARGIKAQARAVKDVREKEELRKRFMKIHSLSVLMNSIVLIMGITTILITAYHLRI